MKLTAMKSVKVKLPDGDRNLEPGEMIEIPDSKIEKARQYIEKGILKPVTSTPLPPILPGWVVSYRGSTGQIRGGTVKAGRRHGGVWAFELEDGTAIPEGQILSVARVEGGRWLAAWAVKDWGLDGARLFAER